MSVLPLMEPGEQAEKADPLVLTLGAVTRSDVARVGGKAGTLGELLQAGYGVPDGFVITTAAFASWLKDGADQLSPELEAAIESALGGLIGTLAVRSSGVAEDSTDASYAGLYESYLGIQGAEGVKAAVRRCFASVASHRVDAYRQGAGDMMAVLVQRQVAADAAGVAFTANPVTGARDEVVIDSVNGLADRLVSGKSDPDRWVVKDGEAVCLSNREGSLDSRLALEISALATSIEGLLGGPQDVEWAVGGGEVRVIQARPITALPEPVVWPSALPGAWIRNFRLGEWIGEPVTPLFDTWLLARLEAAFYGQYSEWFGFRVLEPHHQTVNGWYFSTLSLPSSPGRWVAMIAAVLARFARDPKRTSAALPPLAGFGMDVYIREWREKTLPRYDAIVRSAESQIESADLASLIGLVDEMANLAGRYFASLTVVAGYGWKTELPLAKFYNDHLSEAIGGSHQVLLSGLSELPLIPPHSVQNLDWHRATLGELGGEASDAPNDSSENVRRKRAEQEESAELALSGDPKLARRFKELLGKAQDAARIRDEHVSHFTLAWPMLRAGALRIGAALEDAGVLAEAEDIFFMTYEEMASALADFDGDPMIETVTDRRQEWARQRKLSPPEVLGEIPRPMQSMFLAAEKARSGVVAEGAIVGQPASPGRVTAVARVITELDESDRLGEGEVLVAPLTTPAWTPLFRRAAGVVTDVGSVISHASLLAREYGIPAVVGTGVGTSRIGDGALVTVDGSSGYVEVLN